MIREKRNFEFLLTLIVAVCMITGCGSLNVTQPVTVGTVNDKEVNEEEQVTGPLTSKLETLEQENGALRVLYQVWNETEQDQVVQFTSGLKVDMEIYDENGVLVRQYSDEVLSTQALEELSLKKGEIYEEEIIIDQLINGTYTLHVYLNVPERAGETSEQITIKSSIYNKGEGVISKVHPDLIEVTIESEQSNFQLTDFAKEQLLDLSEEEEISFIYTETEIEDKMIESFLYEREHILLERSPLELDQELIDISTHLIEADENSVLSGYQPFEVFQMYMYTQAGEDYGTMYKYYPEGSVDISKEQFVEEGRSGVNTVNQREFMSKFNEVREFEVITKERAATVLFTFNEEERFTFQLERHQNIWLVKPMPLQ
ncbi:BsuPI-related putative proteinase inhibitor [Halalkalibacter akibai]|uniref:Intracellular proteinase inhibitor BsuPI domain-containing protein n=1 Tax=Halalkalibacter akibai (strain ATCC 43226 / DSM 21942 / CIP 109018 / JCM 9157 / 1139) TaxID=1236973 RepID=W4QTT3_HALA3|nr:BsuPI-related putative proteinase inhibitor [Halalkalibacter akibai]GAE35476.1 hypothetical protein JCM9157_2585 [Halalkalibacter akibai JCM 9157]